MTLFGWPRTSNASQSDYRLLGNEDASDDGLKEQEKSPMPRKENNRLRKSYLAPLLHVLCFTLYSALFFVLVFSSQKKCADDQTQVWSPARSVLEPRKTLFVNEIGDGNPYRGKPRPELDAAWDKLIEYSNVRVSADDLRRINRTSVQLSDGSGKYWSGLNVHHQLHCLKMVRQAVFPEYYFDGKKPPRHLEEHIDHCVDNIRMTLMCKADISLGSYDWVDNNRRPLTNFYTEHSCYNWDAVNDWARVNSFDMYDNVSLVHPTLGKSYPLDSEGHYIFTEEMDPFLGNKITPPLV